MVRSTKMTKVRYALLLISFILFPVTMNWMSPYLPMAGAAEGILVGSLLFYGLLFIGGMFGGRLFCGWLCPMGGMQEACFTIREKPVAPWIRWIKWGIWIPWAGMIGSLLIKASGLVVEPLYLFENGISVDSAIGLIRYLIVVFVVFLLAVGGGRRFFCHSACWAAPFMILGKKFGKVITVPQVHLKADSESCTGCDRCTKSCPMSLPVLIMVKENRIDHSECVLCGNCTHVCSRKSIQFVFDRGEN